MTQVTQDPEQTDETQDANGRASAVRAKSSTAYKVYADRAAMLVLAGWINEHAEPESLPLGDWLPIDKPYVEPDDLVFLGTYEGATRDDAASALLADLTPPKELADRVKLVQSVVADQVDLYLPAVPVSYLKPAAIVWEVNPVLTVGGRPVGKR